MKYSSQSGCLFYYDRVLYSWQVCEPTMLFILGFESITGYSNSSSDTITIIKTMYDEKLRLVVPLNKFTTFDSIYSYLSQFSSVEDTENYAKYECNGVKLLLNDLSGTGNDRTIPIIFHTDINNKYISLNSDMCRIDKDNYTKMSTFDLQSQKILDIFEDAGFSGSFDSVKYSLGYINTDEAVPTTDLDLVKEINNNVKLLYDEKVSNSNIYKLLDYKCMYSYSLGVLYGCRCLGYSPYLVFRMSPKYWYNGDNFNLVNTAWNTFRFYYFHHIEELEQDSNKKEKYQSIVENDIWNFTNDSLSDVLYKPDEELVFSVTDRYFSNEKEVSTFESHIYSKSTEPQSSHIHSGSYLYDLSKDKESSDWHSIDEIISNENPKTGIISQKYISRYFCNKEIRIFPSYYCGNDEYLSPNNSDKYFIFTDLIGWVPFDENLWRYFGSNNNSSSGGSAAGSSASSSTSSGSASGISNSLPVLTLSPRKFTDLPSGSGANLFKGKAITNQEPHTTVGFYRCYLTYEPTPVFLYGIYDESYIGAGTDFALPDDFAFTRVMREDEFNDNYSIVYDLQMFDSSLETAIPIIDESAIQIIIMNNEEISYSDFYSHSNYGIIREELYVFNQNFGGSSALTKCYHDTNSQYERYCIPGVTQEWVSRQDITALGYIFVDGVTEIYDGNTSVEVIVDNNPED